MRADTLTLTNLDGAPLTYVSVLASEASVACSVISEGAGDIEIAFGIEDCKKIVSILEEASRPRPEESYSENHPCSFSHRFKNLDGGAAATFTVSRTNDLAALTLERADEGNLAFRISLEDTECLIEALKKTLKIALSLRPTGLTDN